MPFQNILGTNGQLRKAIKELQGFKQTIVIGAAVNTDIAIHDIKLDDAIASVVNLTDGANISITGVKAYNGTWTGAFDTVLEATETGVAGNDITVELAGDATASTAVVVTVDPYAKTVFIRYKTGVNTIAQIEAAIAALTGGYKIIAVKAAGTGATVLTASGDDVSPTNLADGINTVTDEIPTITSRGNIQFALVDTSTKKLLVSYYVTDETD